MIRTLPRHLWVRYTLGRTLLYGALSLGAFMAVFPFLWMILTSFKNYAEAIATPPILMPAAWLQRLHLVGYMLWTHPLLLVGLLLWLALGIGLALRWPRVWQRLAYPVAHVTLWFLAWGLGLFGPALRWNVLWQEGAQALGLKLIPFWGNYIQAWATAPFGRYFLNSVIMSVGTPALIMVTGVPAAYAFARMRFPGKDLLFVLFLATMMIPEEVILIPNYITISRLKWMDSYQALIVPWIVNVVTIFFLRQFFKSIPDELYDAAVLDGSSHLHFMRTIALPLATPALVSTALFNFLGSWNSVQWPLYVTNSPWMRPLMVGMKYFSDEMGMQVHLHNAAATFTTLPVIILFLLVQKQFIEGIARTGIK